MKEQPLVSHYCRRLKLAKSDDCVAVLHMLVRSWMGPRRGRCMRSVGRITLPPVPHGSRREGGVASYMSSKVSLRHRPAFGANRDPWTRKPITRDRLILR